MGLASKLAASQQNQPPKQIIQQPQGSQNHSFQAGYSNETSYQGSVPPADHGYPSSQRGNSQYAPSSSNHRYQGSSPASQSAYQPSQGPPHSQMNPPGHIPQEIPVSGYSLPQQVSPPGYFTNQQPPHEQHSQQQYQNASGGQSPGVQRNQIPDYYKLLKRAVQENQLGAFYVDQDLKRIAGTVHPKLMDVSVKWKIPFEIAVDLSRLALYDIILYIDDSGSMKFEEGGTRIDDLKVILTRTAYIGGLFDDNGIEAFFMNSSIKGQGLTKPEQVLPMIDRVKFNGITPLGTALEEKILKPLVLKPAAKGKLKKPVLIITITDGEPTGEASKKVFKVIAQTKKELLKSKYKSGACAFQFAQVGNDLHARDFLGKLDTDPVVGKMVDCTSNFEVEQDEMAKLGVSLDPSTWLVKMLLGAIDPSYDSQDE